MLMKRYFTFENSKKFEIGKIPRSFEETNIDKVRTVDVGLRCARAVQCAAALPRGHIRDTEADSHCFTSRRHSPYCHVIDDANMRWRGNSGNNAIIGDDRFTTDRRYHYDVACDDDDRLTSSLNRS